MQEVSASCGEQPVVKRRQRPYQALILQSVLATGAAAQMMLLDLQTHLAATSLTAWAPVYTMPIVTS